jgi:hypothetical protein
MLLLRGQYSLVEELTVLTSVESIILGCLSVTRIALVVLVHYHFNRLKLFLLVDSIIFIIVY